MGKQLNSRPWGYESDDVGFINVNNFKWLQLQRFSAEFISLYM